MSESLDTLLREIGTLIGIAMDTLSPDELSTFKEEIEHQLTYIEDDEAIYPSERI